MSPDVLFQAEVLLLGRLLFGGVLAFTGVNHFLETDDMEAYARAKGVPEPRLGVQASGALLVFGGLSIVTGAYPDLGSLFLVAFFAVVTPVMHAFWRYEGEERQQEMTHFLKNASLLGGSLTFLYLSAEPWGYGLGYGVIAV